MSHVTDLELAQAIKALRDREAIDVFAELADTLDDMMTAMIEPAPSTFEEWS